MMIDPTTGEWIAEYVTRAADGDVTRKTEWFATREQGEHFKKTGEITPRADACETCKTPGAPAHEQSPRCQYRPEIRPHCTCSRCF